MKLERLHEHVTATVAILFAVVFSIWCGKLTGSGATKLIEEILGVVAAIVTGLVLRKRIWILIPFFGSFGGGVPFLPLSLGELAILLAFGWNIVFIALKVIRTKVNFRFLDIVLFANVIYLLTVFIRHPVGVDYFNSDRVGGKGYFTAAIDFLGYMVLMRATLNEKDARFLPLYSVVGSVFSTFSGAVGCFFPSVGTALGAFYTGFTPLDPAAASAAGAEPQSRFQFTSAAGSAIILLLCSYFEPLSLLTPLYFWRFLLTGVSFFLVLVSGFRSVFAGSVITLYLGEYFRNRAMAVIKLSVLGGSAVALLIFAQGRLIELPIAAQRALSFLPGKWASEAEGDAEGSTEWRIMMWKAMLTEHKYLENRWFGDGYGFTRQQLEGIIRNSEESQENFLITGEVHSGPVSAIKYVGFVGLGLFLFLILVMAREASKLMRRAYGTPYFAVAVFIGIPVVFLPLQYVFIFGAFQNSLPAAMLSVGMLNLIRRGLDEHRPTDSRPPDSTGSFEGRPILISR